MHSFKQMQKLIILRKYEKYGGPSYQLFQTDTEGWFFQESIKNFVQIKDLCGPGFGGLGWSIYDYLRLSHA